MVELMRKQQVPAHDDVDVVGVVDQVDLVPDAVAVLLDGLDDLLDDGGLLDDAGGGQGVALGNGGNNGGSGVSNGGGGEAGVADAGVARSQDATLGEGEDSGEKSLS